MYRNKLYIFENLNKQTKKPLRTINYVLTAGGLLLLSIYVKSSYKTTPKLHTSEATENLLSVRDSGAYLQHMVKGIFFCVMCLFGLEDISFNDTDFFP